jgi:phage protein U
MAGPTTLILGAFPFEALGFSFQSIKTGMRTPWAEIKIAQGWDALQFMGPSKQTATIEGVLFPEAFGGEGSLAGIEALAVQGLPMPLISLGGTVFGLFVVEAVRQDMSVISGRGQARRDAYVIDLRRYQGTGPGTIIGAAIRLFT